MWHRVPCNVHIIIMGIVALLRDTGWSGRGKNKKILIFLFLPLPLQPVSLANGHITSKQLMSILRPKDITAIH